MLNTSCNAIGTYTPLTVSFPAALNPFLSSFPAAKMGAPSKFCFSLVAGPALESQSYDDRLQMLSHTLPVLLNIKPSQQHDCFLSKDAPLAWVCRLKSWADLHELQSYTIALDCRHTLNVLKARFHCPRIFHCHNRNTPLLSAVAAAPTRT